MGAAGSSPALFLGEPFDRVIMDVADDVPYLEFLLNGVRDWYDVFYLQSHVSRVFALRGMRDLPSEIQGHALAIAEIDSAIARGGCAADVLERLGAGYRSYAKCREEFEREAWERRPRRRRC